MTYETLIQTIKGETMDGETTYTRKEAQALAQDWRNEEQQTTLKAADEQMQAARDAYFQAIETYKQAYSASHSKLLDLQNAINKCYYKSEESSKVWAPVNLVSFSPSTALMQVTSKEVGNSKLHVKEIE